MIDDLDIRLREQYNTSPSPVHQVRTENDKKKSTFSLGQTVIFETLDKNDGQNNILITLDKNFIDLKEKVHEISLYFEKDHIEMLFNQILNNKEILEIQGKILKE